MESHEVLRRAVEPVGAKRVAHELRVSSSLVYKWCEEDETSGARNPLDRIRVLVAATGSTDPVHWLCRQADGFFVKDPAGAEQPLDSEYIAHTHKLLGQFADLLRVVSESITNDGCIDEEEAQRIRTEWDELKSYAESFVLACEQGRFDDPRAKGDTKGKRKGKRR